MTLSSKASPQILPLHLALEKATPLPAQHFPCEFLQPPWEHQLQKASSCWVFAHKWSVTPLLTTPSVVMLTPNSSPAGKQGCPIPINSRGSRAPSCWRAPALQPEELQRQRDDCEQFLRSRASRNARSRSSWSCRSRAAAALRGVCSFPVLNKETDTVL